MFESHAFLLHLRHSPKYWDTLPTTLQIDYKPIPNDATKHFRMTTSGFGRNWTTPRCDKPRNPRCPGIIGVDSPDPGQVGIPESPNPAIPAKPGFPISRIPGIFPIPAKLGFKEVPRFPEIPAQSGSAKSRLFSSVIFPAAKSGRDGAGFGDDFGVWVRALTSRSLTASWAQARPPEPSSWELETSVAWPGLSVCWCVHTWRPWPGALQCPCILMLEPATLQVTSSRSVVHVPVWVAVDSRDS